VAHPREQARRGRQGSLVERLAQHGAEHGVGRFIDVAFGLLDALGRRRTLGREHECQLLRVDDGWRQDRDEVEVLYGEIGRLARRGGKSRDQRKRQQGASQHQDSYR
jgi:hypothetical protein